VTFRGGLRRAIPFLLVGQGRVRDVRRIWDAEAGMVPGGKALRCNGRPWRKSPGRNPARLTAICRMYSAEADLDTVPGVDRRHGDGQLDQFLI
jgi:hypothetical protein